MDKQLLKSFSYITAVLLVAGIAPGCKHADEIATEHASGKEAGKEPVQEVKKNLEPITGLSAIHQMYRPARDWSADALPLSLASSEIPQVANDGGKVAMWTAVFASGNRRAARTAFYSAIDGTAPRGVSMSGEQGWSGATTKSTPFNPTQLFVDSDQAYKTALEKAEPWLKTHPGKKPTITLVSGIKTPAPVWIIMWGDTKAGYLAFVNAASGKVMTER